MRSRNDGGMAIILIVGVVAGVIFWISSELGASFSSVAWAIASLLVVGGVLFALWWRLNNYGLLLLSAFFAIGWPATWPVLTSIANGGRDPDSSFRPWQHEQSFIDSAWMTWGVEVIFVAILAAAAFHAYRRRLYW